MEIFTQDNGPKINQMAKEKCFIQKTKQLQKELGKMENWRIKLMQNLEKSILIVNKSKIKIDLMEDQLLNTVSQDGNDL